MRQLDTSMSEQERERLAQHYEREGYILLEDALSPEEVDEIRDEALSVCKGERGEIQGWSPPQPSDSDDEVLKRYLAIHFPHKFSEVIHKSLFHPRIVDALTTVIGPNVKAVQSMLFIKASGKPGQAWHQDEYFIPTRDRSLAGVWIAIDDATIDNGCLWVIPGSHRPAVIYAQREQHDDRFDVSGEAFGFPYDDDEAIPLEVRSGSVVVFNGYLLHRSLPNVTKGGYRRALANHYMSAESLLPWRWPAQETSIALLDCRDIVLVAGTDPYAYKGTEDVWRPMLRLDPTSK